MRARILVMGLAFMGLALGLPVGLLVLWASPPAHAATTVTNLDDAGPGSLRQAIIAANQDPGPDVIEFDLKSGDLPGAITLTGGELKIEEDLSIHGPGADQLTVSGGGKSRIFSVTDASVEISGLTISDGSAQEGAGILLTDGMLTLTQTVLSGNSATDTGGAIHISSGTATIEDSMLSGNSVTGPLSSKDSDLLGGAIYNGGTSTINRSTLSGNVAVHAGGAILGRGGAISNAGIVVISESTFEGNSALEGGGLFNLAEATLDLAGSTLTENGAWAGAGLLNWGEAAVSGSHILGNTAQGPDVFSGSFGGGGLYNSADGVIDITDSVIRANKGDGGAGLWNWGIGTIVRSVFSDNEYNAIDNRVGGELSIQNVTVSGNWGGQSFEVSGTGGIVVTAGIVTIDSSTIANNVAGWFNSGGIINFAGAVSVRNTIIADNTGIQCIASAAANPTWTMLAGINPDSPHPGPRR